MRRSISYSLLALLALIAALAASPAAAQCSSRRVRKEISDLTVDEMRAYLNGMKTLYSNGVSNRFVQMHERMADEAHNTPQFLPYHRLMGKMFEDELLKVAPGLSGMPYWDAAYSYRTPAQAFVFRADIFGEVRPAAECLTGTFASIRDTNGGCVRRQERTRYTLFAPELMLASLTGNNDFDSFQRSLQFGQHASVHNYVMGNMGNVLYSPTDPIFWLHHAAVDYYWARWQGLNNNGNYNKYGGVHRPQAENRVVTASDKIESTTAGAIIDYYNTFCYEYQDPRNAPRGQAPFPQGALTGSVTATPTSSAPSATPTAGPNSGNITEPSGLTDEFIKQFRLDTAQASKAREMVRFFVARLNDRVAKGEKLPTLADLSSITSGSGASPAATATAAASVDKSDASSLTAAGPVGAVVAAVMAILVA